MKTGFEQDKWDEKTLYCFLRNIAIKCMKKEI